MLTFAPLGPVWGVQVGHSFSSTAVGPGAQIELAETSTHMPLFVGHVGGTNQQISYAGNAPGGFGNAGGGQPVGVYVPPPGGMTHLLVVATLIQPPDPLGM